MDPFGDRRDAVVYSVGLRGFVSARQKNGPHPDPSVYFSPTPHKHTLIYLNANPSSSLHSLHYIVPSRNAFLQPLGGRCEKKGKQACLCCGCHPPPHLCFIQHLCHCPLPSYRNTHPGVFTASVNKTSTRQCSMPESAFFVSTGKDGWLTTVSWSFRLPDISICKKIGREKSVQIYCPLLFNAFSHWILLTY